VYELRSTQRATHKTIVPEIVLHLDGMKRGVRRKKKVFLLEAAAGGIERARPQITHFLAHVVAGQRASTS
jgi:hypothetical protein